MKQKEVTINGHKYPVAFTLDTLFGVEDIINGSFFDANFGTLKNRMALVLAAIYTADENADITVDTLKAMEPFKMIQDVTTAFVTISELMSEFFKVPATEPADNTTETADEEKPKN